jgi:sialidase-1
MQRARFFFSACLSLSSIAFALSAAPENVAGIKKVEDILIYEDAKFYSAFPSIVRRKNGELLVAFRRAPERRNLGEKSISHTDGNSYLVLVRSQDQGKTWTRNPELIYAHPFGGSQDPCLLQLRDGSLLCASYAWASVQPEAIARMNNVSRLGNYVFLGGFLVRSKDDGRTWQGPIVPPPSPGEKTLDIFGERIPAYNRGALCEGRDGRIFWAVAHHSLVANKTECKLMVSSDKGSTWNFACNIASDSKVSFNETSLYETPGGDLIAFMRTETFDDHTALARSTDHGKSFHPWEDTGFQGHPHFALRLPDQRVLLVYGYRHAPFGVRARLLNSECTNFASSPELILRDDGGNSDLGYPWATMLSNHRALVVYYFNRADGTRSISGTILSID